MSPTIRTILLSVLFLTRRCSALAVVLAPVAAPSPEAAEFQTYLLVLLLVVLLGPLLGQPLYRALKKSWRLIGFVGWRLVVVAFDVALRKWLT